MQPVFEAYRQLPDNRNRVAQHLFYLIAGKLLLGLVLLITVLMVTGIIQHRGWFWTCLGVLPLALFVALLWPGFPAFCRCPECRKQMTRRSKEGKILRQHGTFTEQSPTRHYLVCARCQLYVFLGESE